MVFIIMPKQSRGFIFLGWCWFGLTYFRIACYYITIIQSAQNGIWSESKHLRHAGLIVKLHWFKGGKGGEGPFTLPPIAGGSSAWTQSYFMGNMRRFRKNGKGKVVTSWDIQEQRLIQHWYRPKLFRTSFANGNDLSEFAVITHVIKTGLLPRFPGDEVTVLTRAARRKDSGGQLQHIPEPR